VQRATMSSEWSELIFTHSELVKALCHSAQARRRARLTTRVSGLWRALTHLIRGTSVLWLLIRLKPTTSALPEHPRPELAIVVS
jgi:hypothetical protein